MYQALFWIFSNQEHSTEPRWYLKNCIKADVFDIVIANWLKIMSINSSFYAEVCVSPEDMAILCSWIFLFQSHVQFSN